MRNRVSMNWSGGGDRRLELRTLRTFCRCLAVCLGASCSPSLGLSVSGGRETGGLASVSIFCLRDWQPMLRGGTGRPRRTLVPLTSVQVLRDVRPNPGHCRRRLSRLHTQPGVRCSGSCGPGGGRRGADQARAEASSPSARLQARPGLCSENEAGSCRWARVVC